MSRPNVQPGTAPVPMNGTDAALWEIERDPALRTTVVSVLMLDRAVKTPRLLAVLEDAVRNIVRLRQHVVEPPLGIGVPQWVTNDELDIADHFVAENVGVDESWNDAVLRVAADCAVEPFDRSRPLWEAHYLAHPGSGDAASGALILKVHHSLADGVGGVGLLDVLLDRHRRRSASSSSTTAAAHAEPSETPDSSEDATRAGSGVVADVSSTLRSVAETPGRVAKATFDAVTNPVKTASSIVSAGQSAGRLLAPSGEALSPLFDERGPERHLGIHEAELARLHDAAAKHGCSVNHLFFAGVLGGAAAHHRHHGAPTSQLRVTMPVSFRRSDDPEAGNQWSPLRFRVPTDIDDPVTRMHAIKAITSRTRREPAIGLTNKLAGLVQMLPGALSAGIVSAMMSGVDATLTNVPGLHEPRYLAGARVERIYGFAPTAGTAFSVALLSHDTMATFGITVDTGAVADPDGLCAAIAEHLDTVVEAAEAADPLPADDDVDLGDSAERLTALDVGFLDIETFDTPMHLGGLFLLDGAPLRDDAGALRLGDIERHVEKRLALAPRYRQRFFEVPLQQHRPVWADDPKFDIANHVRTATVSAPGGMAELRELVADINHECLDRDQPLWELWVIDGLETGDVAILQKVHHALADGIGSVELATVLYDVTEEAPQIRPPWRKGVEPPTAQQLVLDAWSEHLRDPIDVARQAVEMLTTTPAEAVRQMQTVADGLTDMLGPRSVAPPTPLNDDVGELRSVASVDLPRGLIDEVRESHGGSPNDVALAAITGGLRRWLTEHHADVIELHALCPVSTRTVDEHGTAGNHVGAMLISLPVDEPDPVERLELIGRRTRRAKRRHDGEGVARALETLDHLPAIGGALLRSFISHQRYVNLVVTNVPGPPAPLWFMGARARSILPIVPLGPNTGLGVALLSYGDVVTVGLHADPERCPDLDAIGDEILADLRALAAAEGAGSTP